MQDKKFLVHVMHEPFSSSSAIVTEEELKDFKTLEELKFAAEVISNEIDEMSVGKEAVFLFCEDSIDIFEAVGDAKRDVEFDNAVSEFDSFKSFRESVEKVLRNLSTARIGRYDSFKIYTIKI